MCAGRTWGGARDAREAPPPSNSARCAGIDIPTGGQFGEL